MGSSSSQRKRARDEAIASARLEGEQISPQAQEDLDAYVRGEITLEEVRSRTLKRYSSSKNGMG